MKIILAPTKAMKRKNFVIEKSKPKFLVESKQLREILKGYDKEKIKRVFKVSDKLADRVYQYYQAESESISAINLYDGLVFKYLKVDSFTKAELAFLNKHVVILSSLYGALLPSDAISEYRLDYNVDFDLNLSEFWSSKLADYFFEDEVIINLASLEFSKNLPQYNLINIHFLNKDLKAHSTSVKMARGDFLNYLITNKITEKEALKSYRNFSYKYEESMSDENNYYFLKE